MDLSTATPREIDSALRDAYWRLAKAEHQLLRATQSACRNTGETDESYSYNRCRFQYNSLHVAGGYRQRSYTIDSFLDLDAADTVEYGYRGPVINGVDIDRAFTRMDGAEFDLHDKIGTTDFYAVARLIRDDHDRVAQALDELDTIRQFIDDANVEYVRRGRWNRYWLVTSSQGHIHSTTDCSTCNKGRNATTFALVCDISDADPVEAVDIFGAALCSICYPDAPVEMTDQVKITPARAKAYAEGGIDAYRALVAKAEARKGA